MEQIRARVYVGETREHHRPRIFHVQVDDLVIGEQVTSAPTVHTGTQSKQLPRRGDRAPRVVGGPRFQRCLGSKAFVGNPGGGP